MGTKKRKNWEELNISNMTDRNIKAGDHQGRIGQNNVYSYLWYSFVRSIIGLVPKRKGGRRSPTTWVEILEVRMQQNRLSFTRQREEYVGNLARDWVKIIDRRHGNTQKWMVQQQKGKPALSLQHSSERWNPVALPPHTQLASRLIHHHNQKLSLSLSLSHCFWDIMNFRATS